MEFITQHLPEFWYVVGFGLLAIEATVLGLSSGVVLFAGIAALITGGLLSAELLSHTWLSSIASFAIFSMLTTALLWKPFKNMQNRIATPDADRSSDLIGHSFVLEQDITTSTPGKTRYSGIDWKVEIEHGSGLAQIEKGTQVKVSTVSAGIFRVTPA